MLSEAQIRQTLDELRALGKETNEAILQIIQMIQEDEKIIEELATRLQILERIGDKSDGG